MSTYLELRTRVLRRLIDAPTAITAEVPDLVNEAIKQAEQEHNFWVMQYTVDFTTTLSTRTLGTLPADFKEFKGKAFRTDQTLGQTRELTYAPHIQAANRRWAQTDIGDPRLLVQTSVDTAGLTSLAVYPLPDGNSDWTDGEYRLSVPYWRYVPALVADGDTNWFTTTGYKYIIAQATSDGFALDWDEGRAGYWRDQANLEKAKLILRDKKIWLSTFDTLVPHLDVYDPQLSE